jgi:POT family proton-dependent oligopeptide transporter
MSRTVADAIQEVGLKKQTLFGHPIGLTVLFLTGMWEVFALVGLRAVLIFYLIKDLHYSNPLAIQVYAQSTAACALMGLIGGFAADRYFGVRRSVVWGALLMSVGNLLLVFPVTLFFGLAILAVGNGLLRPTLLAEVGFLYPRDDPRRDTAYTAYKVGTNLGAFLAPLICAPIGAIYGWRWSFAASSVGMLIATAVFLGGLRYLPKREEADIRKTPSPANLGVPDRRTLTILCMTWLGAILFWTAYKQIETTVPLWADVSVDRLIHIGPWSATFPAAMLQSVNPLMIFAFAPIVTWLWSRGTKHTGPGDDLRKMAIGAVLLAAAYVILAIAAQFSPSHANPLWLVLAVAPLSFGELYLDPVGQALYSRLGRNQLASLLMAVWFFALFVAYQVTGLLGNLWGNVPTSIYFWGTAALALLCAPFMIIARHWTESRREVSTASVEIV